ncbi:MAG: hypothetical protein IPH44_35695 [Myxococcales bacterium]|nr:hypothetical protein [Myxococcales bacterium]
MAVLNEIIAAAPDPMALVARGRRVVRRRRQQELRAGVDAALGGGDGPHHRRRRDPPRHPVHAVVRVVDEPARRAGVDRSDEIIGGIVVDILKIASKCLIPTGADDPRKPTLESGARILAAIRQLHPAEGMLWFGSSMVARRIGATGEALQFAQHAYQIDPSWKAAVGVANALRDAQASTRRPSGSRRRSSTTLRTSARTSTAAT